MAKIFAVYSTIICTNLFWKFHMSGPIFAAIYLSWPQRVQSDPFLPRTRPPSDGEVDPLPPEKRHDGGAAVADLMAGPQHAALQRSEANGPRSKASGAVERHGKTMNKWSSPTFPVSQSFRFRSLFRSHASPHNRQKHPLNTRTELAWNVGKELASKNASSE